MHAKRRIVSKYLLDLRLLFVLHLLNSLLIVSFHSIKSTLKRSLDIDGLPHGSLLNLVVSIKSYYDSIAQWIEAVSCLSFLAESIFTFIHLHPSFRLPSPSHIFAQPKQTKPLFFITSLISHFKP